VAADRLPPQAAHSIRRLAARVARCGGASRAALLESVDDEANHRRLDAERGRRRQYAREAAQDLRIFFN
jgi:hypothetical protein